MNTQFYKKLKNIIKLVKKLSYFQINKIKWTKEPYTGSLY